jgi:TatD DNase family protein
MKLLDAHVHLTDSEFSGYIHHILNNLRALKIKACSVTVDIETSLAGLRLFDTSNRDVVMQFIGIHPKTFATKGKKRYFVQCLPWLKKQRSPYPFIQGDL